MATSTNSEAGDGLCEQSKPPFLRRVRIRGYKSIAFCDVTLVPLTILVGRNASGKSNFLDALAFLSDVVVKGVHEAVKLHGGRDAVLCQLTNSSFISLEIEAGYQPQGEAEPWAGIFTVEIALPARGNRASSASWSVWITRRGSVGPATRSKAVASPGTGIRMSIPSTSG